MLIVPKNNGTTANKRGSKFATIMILTGDEINNTGFAVSSSCRIILIKLAIDDNASDPHTSQYVSRVQHSRSHVTSVVNSRSISSPCYDVLFQSLSIGTQKDSLPSSSACRMTLTYIYYALVPSGGENRRRFYNIRMMFGIENGIQMLVYLIVCVQKLYILTLSPTQRSRAH
jgi:hypothetical protein